MSRLVPYAGQELSPPKPPRKRDRRKSVSRHAHRFEFRSELIGMAPLDAIRKGQELGLTRRAIARSSGHSLDRIQHEVRHWLGRPKR